MHSALEAASTGRMFTESVASFLLLKDELIMGAAEGHVSSRTAARRGGKRFDRTRT